MNSTQDDKPQKESGGIDNLIASQQRAFARDQAMDAYLVMDDHGNTRIVWLPVHRKLRWVDGIGIDNYV